MTLSIGVMSVGVNDGFLDYAREAQGLGVSSVWTGEFWGLDVFRPLVALPGRRSTRLGARGRRIRGACGTQLITAGTLAANTTSTPAWRMRLRNHIRPTPRVIALSVGPRNAFVTRKSVSDSVSSR